MNTHYNDQLQNYLLWNQERGQVWPYNHILHSDDFNKQKDLSLKQNDSPPTNDSLISDRNLFIHKGPVNAKIYGFVDAIEHQDIIFGKERELLIKILQSIHVNLKSDFRLVAFKTNSCSLPIGKKAEYQKQLQEMFTCFQPKIILSFGRLAYKLLSKEPKLFKSEVHMISRNIINFEHTKFLPLEHLQEIAHSTEIKKNTWQSLKRLTGIM